MEKEYIVRYTAYIPIPNKRYIGGCRIIKAESEEEALSKFDRNDLLFKVPTSYNILKRDVVRATKKDLR